MTNTLGSMLKMLRINDGELHYAPSRAEIVDSRGRTVASDRALVGFRDTRQLFKVMRPYIHSVLIFEGKLKVCL